MPRQPTDFNETVLDLTKKSEPGAVAANQQTVVQDDRTVTCLNSRVEDAAAPQPAPEELRAIDPARFEKQALVGRGGMGTVHLAFDQVMLRGVALKTLSTDRKRHPKAEQHFLEEAQITGQLDHPNIAPVYDLGLGGNGVPCFTMKFVDGQTYTSVIRAFHESPKEACLHDLLRMFLKVCEAIAFAHERGVIHCDIKPDNIMIGSHGQVYVMDWGVALLRQGQRPSELEPEVSLSDYRRRRNSMGGTIGYMAPEQIEGEDDRISATTDVYGLGGILFFMLTGKSPRHDFLAGAGGIAWDSDVVDIEGQRAMPVVPPQLCRIAERALRADPAKRFQSVDELRSEIEGFLAGGGWFATRRFEAGEVVIREGEVGTEAFIITDGVCDVLKSTSRGDELIRSMGPGDAFGELSVLTSLPRSATVVAKTDVSVRVVTPETLERELERNPVLAGFMSAVAKRFMDLEARLASNEGDD